MDQLAIGHDRAHPQPAQGTLGPQELGSLGDCSLIGSSYCCQSLPCIQGSDNYFTDTVTHWLMSHDHLHMMLPCLRNPKCVAGPGRRDMASAATRLSGRAKRGWWTLRTGTFFLGLLLSRTYPHMKNPCPSINCGSTTLSQPRGQSLGLSLTWKLVFESFQP